MEFEVGVPRIEPLRTSIDMGGESVDTAEIHLTGLPRGAVLLLTSAGTLWSQAPELMNGLAEHGYETLAVDLSGLSLDDSGRRVAIERLLDRLGQRGWRTEQIGVVGYADGGRSALIAACEGTLGAAVSVSPTHVLDIPAPVIRTPWLGMFGELDDGMPLSEVNRLDRQLSSSSAYHRLVVYPGADGLFFNRSGSTLGHAAAFDAWQRTVEWLNLRVVPRASPYAELWARRTAGQSSPLTQGRK